MRNKSSERLLNFFYYVTYQIRFTKKLYFQDKINNFNDNTEAICDFIDELIRPSGSNKMKDVIKTILHNDTRDEKTVAIAKNFTSFHLMLVRQLLNLVSLYSFRSITFHSK